MNNFIDMNDVEQLIIDKLTGQIGDEEETRLEQLIARHSEVEQLWQQMQQVYAMRKAVSFDSSFNADTAWAAMQQKLGLSTMPQQGVPDTVAIQPKHRIAWVRYAVAAAVTGIIVVAGWLLINYNSTAQPGGKPVKLLFANGKLVEALPGEDIRNKVRLPQADLSAWNRLTVPAGKSYQFQLGDKTGIWLNAASDCWFPMMFSGVDRHIMLKGEGYFKVAHNPSQPFVVTVNGLRVKALGTEFNIRSYPGEASIVSLVKGSVLVAYNGAEMVLQPGDAAVLQGHRLHKERFDERAITAWMRGFYIYHDERLDSIAAVAERWFDVQVQLKEPGMAGMRFTGEIDRNKSVTNFFDLLSSTGYIHYEYKDGTIILSRN